MGAGGGMQRRQCFTDISQLVSLLLSGRIADILDDEVRNDKYPLVAMPVGLRGGCDVDSDWCAAAREGHKQAQDRRTQDEHAVAEEAGRRDGAAAAPGDV